MEGTIQEAKFFDYIAYFKIASGFVQDMPEIQASLARKGFKAMYFDDERNVYLKIIPDKFLENMMKLSLSDFNLNDFESNSILEGFTKLSTAEDIYKAMSAFSNGYWQRKRLR